MKSVFLSSTHNSTMFTTCCEVAICDDQACCPRCKEEVYPGKDTTSHQKRVMRWERAYGPTRRALQAKKGGAA